MQREGALAALADVAEVLGADLRERIVFIGGAIAPLLQSHPPFPGARATDDVDAIVGAVNYTDFERFRRSLKERGFKEMADERHAHRWLAPTDPPMRFDVIPAGDFIGASGNEWDSAALETATASEVARGLEVRHASAAGYLALKFGAFHDRGANDPFSSHDLEDIFALFASRPTILMDVLSAREDVRTYVVDSTRSLAELDEFSDLLSAHLNNVGRTNLSVIIRSTSERLDAIAAAGG